MTIKEKAKKIAEHMHKFKKEVDVERMTEVLLENMSDHELDCVLRNYKKGELVSFDNDKAYQIEFKDEYAKRQFFWDIQGMVDEQDIISKDTIIDAMELYDNIEYNGGDTGESLNLTKKQFNRDYPGLWESFAQYLIIK